MELRQLRYFKVVADARSFARGAQDLRVAQPALSRSIAKLEDEVGQILFVRHSAGVSLTDAGQHLYAYAIRLLASYRELTDGMADFDGELKGELKLGAPQSIQVKLALPAATEFLNKYPRVKLDLIQNSGARLRDQVVGGVIDLAIVPHGTESGMHFTPLAREDICLICHEDDRTALPEQVELGDIMNHPLILSGFPDSLRLLLDRKFSSQERDALNIRSEVNNSFALVHLVMGRVGFGVAPASAASQIAGAPLAAVPIKGLDVHWAVASNWNRRGLRALLEVEQIIIERARRLIDDGEWPNASLSEHGSG